MYSCEFPNCGETTDDRSLIERHHIIPRGNNKHNNLMWVCPGCHKKIYIKGEKYGQHSINKPGRIQIIKWLMSTGGKVLEYKTYDGETQYDKNNNN